MALQLPGYQLSIGSASPPKAFTEYDNAGFYRMADSIAKAGDNLGNALGGYMQRQREQEGLASMASAMNNGDYGSAAMAAANAGDREMAVKLAMAGMQQKQENAALSQVNSILGGGDAGSAANYGSSGGDSAPARPASGNASAAYKMFTDMGYSPTAAAGIVGNLVQESGVRPVGASGDGGTAHGIAQWRADRWNSDHGLVGYANQNGLNPNELSTQVKFLDWELRNRYGDAYKAVQNAKTPEEAAGMFALKFERPKGAETGNYMNIDGIGNRIRQAKALFGTSAGSEQGPPAMAPAVAAGNSPYRVASNGFTPPPSNQPAQPQSAPNTDAIIAKMQNMGKVLMLPNVPDTVKAGIKAQMDVLNSQLAAANEQYRFSRDQDAKYNFENFQTQNQRRTQSLNAELEAQKAFDASTGKGSGDQYNTLRTGAESAYNTLNTLGDLKAAMASPDFRSGTGADYITAAKRLGASVGLDPNVAAPNEVFSALANKLVLDANNGSLGAGVSNADVGFIKSIKPNTAMTPAALNRLVGILEKNEQGKIDLFNQANDYANNHNGRLDIGWDKEMMNSRKAQLESRRQPETQTAPMEGRTATNPQTGQRIILRNGRWEPL